MNCTRRQNGRDSVFAKDHILERVVIGQHGDHNFPAAGICNGLGITRALIDQRLCLCRSAVVNSELVTSLYQRRGHRHSHIA